MYILNTNLTMRMKKITNKGRRILRQSDLLKKEMGQPVYILNFYMNTPHVGSRQKHMKQYKLLTRNKKMYE